MNNEEKARMLGKAFPDMEPEDLANLAAVAHERSYPEGHVLCHEGKVEHTFYAIVSGSVDVHKDLDDGTTQTFNRHGPGSFVGEIALVQDVPRTATVHAVEPVTVLEISRENFLKLLYSSAGMAVRIMLLITARLRENDLATIEGLRRRVRELEQYSPET